jgi:hypothetical protein
MKNYTNPSGAVLPSQLPGGVKAELDEAFERGVALGRRAGLSSVADMIRNLPYSPANTELIITIERMKNEKL